MVLSLSHDSARSYSKYVALMEDAVRVLSGNGEYPFDAIYQGLYESRKYTAKIENRPGFKRALKDAGLFYIFPGVKIQPEWADLGLLDDNGRLMIEGRYCLPIRDFVGGTIGIVGWWPDNRKYITCASKEYFKRGKLYFGLEQVASPRGKGKPAVICEGIFDSIAARSTGFRAYGCMGTDMTPEKESMYTLLGAGKRLLGIPDQDGSGEAVARKDEWHLLTCGTYLRWDRHTLGGYSGLNVKDIDDFVDLVGEHQAAGVLLDALKSMQLTYRVD